MKEFLLTLWTHIYPTKDTETIGILGAEALVEVKTYFPSGSKVAPGGEGGLGQQVPQEPERLRRRYLQPIWKELSENHYSRK